MKKIALILAAALLTAGLAACGGGNSGNNSGNDTPAATSSSTAAAPEATADVDLSNPEIVVEFGDFDGIQALMKKMSNMEVKEGTVIKITGIYQKDTSTPAIMEANAEGTTKLGLSLYLPEGVETPANGTKVEAIGIATKGTYVMEFHVPSAEGFTILE